MYHIAVSFDVSAEHRDAFVAAALADARDSLAEEPGTKSFEVIADETSPNRFYLLEAYVDAEAFQAHAEGPYFKRFFAEVGDLVEGPTWLVKGSALEA